MNRLIEEVRKRPCLHDISSEDYKDAIKRDNSWAEVAQILESDSITVKKNWKKLRDCFRQAVSRRVTESEQKNWKPWRYEKQMAFLLPSMTSRSNRVNYAQHDCEGTGQGDLPQMEASGGQAFVIEDVVTVPKVKKRKSNSSEVDCVVEYVDDSRNNSSKLDDLDLFFASACQSTRKLPRRLQNQVKREILDSIARAEDQNEEVDYKY